MGESIFFQEGGEKGKMMCMFALFTFLSAPVSGVLLSPSGGGAKRVRVSLPGLLLFFFTLFSLSRLYTLLCLACVKFEEVLTCAMC